MTTSLSDAVQQIEQALLGSILLDNSLWPQTGTLSVDDFSLDSHRRMYRQMAAMFEDQRPVDNITLTLELAKSNQLAACGDVAYVTSLLDQGLTINFGAYVRQVSESAHKLRRDRLKERLLDAIEPAAELELIDKMREELTRQRGQADWQSLFHTREEMENAPPLKFAIEGSLQEEGITLIGGFGWPWKNPLHVVNGSGLARGGKTIHKISGPES